LVGRLQVCAEPELGSGATGPGARVRARSRKVVSTNLR